MEKFFSGRTLKLTMTALVACCLMAACEKKKEDETDEASEDPTDGSQSIAQLAGDGVSCAVFSNAGSVLNGKGYTRSLALNADGTYTYSIFFSNNTGCATSSASGGNNIATYYEAGVFSVSGTAGTPSDATKLIFVVGSANMIVRAGTYTTDGGAFATAVNAACGTSFGTSSDNTLSFAGKTCTNTASMNLPSSPAVSATGYNIGYNPGDGTFKLGDPTAFWTPSAGTFPTSYGATFNVW